MKQCSRGESNFTETFHYSPFKLYHLLKTLLRASKSRESNLSPDSLYFAWRTVKSSLFVFLFKIQAPTFNTVFPRSFLMKEKGLPKWLTSLGSFFFYRVQNLQASSFTFGRETITKQRQNSTIISPQTDPIPNFWNSTAHRNQSIGKRKYLLYIFPSRFWSVPYPKGTAQSLAILARPAESAPSCSHRDNPLTILPTHCGVITSDLTESAPKREDL